MNLKQTVTLTVMLHTQQTEQVIAEGYHAEEYEIYGCCGHFTQLRLLNTE